MASVPTEQLARAYYGALDEYNRDISDWYTSSVTRFFGKFVLNLYGDADKMNVELIHYSTYILKLAVDRNDNSVFIKRWGGWSNTDRDNMNGLLRLLGQPCAFYKKDYCLHCDYDYSVHPSGIVWGPVFRATEAAVIE